MQHFFSIMNKINKQMKKSLQGTYIGSHEDTKLNISVVALFIIICIYLLTFALVY